jgi:hypothetical protein
VRIGCTICITCENIAKLVVLNKLAYSKLVVLRRSKDLKSNIYYINRSNYPAFFLVVNYGLVNCVHLMVRYPHKLVSKLLMQESYTLLLVGYWPEDFSFVFP